ncbi:SUMF1/EgtB/PvdO family nonheme iron enzyme [Stieleria neptunia]|nr:SUMF1/EgtB/PvdO family nonheme iron enzyme [Stieleria neptunia]
MTYLLIAVAASMVLASAASAQGRKVAVLVGVNEYQKPAFTSLRFARADVEAVDAELKKLGFTTTLLRGPEATRTRIEDTIDRVVAPLGKDDLMLVMLAGHGQQIEVTGIDGLPSEDAFFCPYDGINRDAESLYSLSHLIDRQLIPNVGRRIVMVDACRNVADDVGRGIQGNATIALPEDTAILFSCRSGQRSFENDTLRHGLFTYAVLEGLRGGAARDGKIVWSQLVSYVDWVMATEQLRRHMPDGTPQVPISAGGIPFAVLGEGNWSEVPTEIQRPKQEELDHSFVNSIGMKFQKIHPGSFIMGSPIDQPGRRPEERPHRVDVSREFHLSVFEVSQCDYEFVMETNPSYFSDWGDGAERLAGQLSDQRPVEQVSWQDANEFCRRLSKLPVEVRAGRRYRLPTEAEWEYACRAGSTAAYGFGDVYRDGQANADGRFASASGGGIFLKQTADIASYRPNAFGIYNMSGNVSEWCQDWFGAAYYDVSPTADPVGPTSGTKRVVRGGSWFDHPYLLRCGSRQSADPGSREPFVGIRVVCDVR